MQVPNGMYIQGGSDMGTGGAGIVASEFTIPAGMASVKSVRADVYSENTGERTVTADITYWPKGHSDMHIESN